jgi:two-component system cell cycle sensor histidine kinase/response regulator CckA
VWWGFTAAMPSDERVAPMKHRAPGREQAAELPWDSVPDLMYRVRGADGTIELLSAAFATLTGWPSTEWIGRPFAELVHADDLPRATSAYTAILRGERPAPHRLRIRTRGGGHVFGEFHSAPFVEQGQVVGEQGIARDVTDRRHAPPGTQEPFRTLFESADEARLLMDGVVFVDLNPKCVEMFGLHDRSDMIGHSPADYSPPLQPGGQESREKAREYVVAALQGCPQRFYWKHSRKDGSTFDTEVALHALTLHGRAHVQATVRDITARRATEQAVRESEERFRVLMAQLPADVWTTDTDLRLTSVYGSLVPRLERQDLRKPGTALYDLFATHDESHPVIAAHRRALAGVSVQYERTAGPLVIEGRVEPLRDGTGTVVGCVGVALDITERRGAQSAVRRLAHFVESSADAILTTALDGTIETWNPAAERLFGYPARGAIGRPITIIASPDRVAELERRARLLEQGQPVEPYETQRVRGDGREMSLSVTMSATRDSRGALVGFSGVVRDITERKRAEEALRSSEEKLRLLLERLPIGISLLDQDRTVTYVNPALEQILGISRDGLLRGEYENRRFVRPDGTSMPPEEFASERAFRERRPVEGVETGVITESGQTIWTSVSATPFAKPEQGVVVATVDVSKRRKAEEALQASETRFRSLIEYSTDLITIVGADGRFKYSSPSASRLLGYDPGEMIGQVGFDFVHPDDVLRIQDAFGRALRVGAVTIREVFRFRHKDGSWRAFESVVTNLMDEPTVAGVVINSRDVTDRVRAEDALRHSEADFRGLVEHATLGIYRATPDGRFLTVNPALIKMLGYGWVEELLQLDITRDVYAHPEQRADLTAQFGQRDEARTETEWKRKDGSLITVRLNVRTVRDPGGQLECYEGLVEDVTEQRSLENQFRQAQRLEAVGRLAGGVAHDFNNILTAITGYSDLLLEDLGPEDPKRPDVEEIKAAALRAAALTRQLLAFSRKQTLQTQVLDLNAVVQTLEKMLRRLIGEDVKLELALASTLGAVRADPGQIEQVILNLAVNSRDAMPNGGRLTIETANVDLDEAYAREHAGVSPGRYVMLAVSDTGVGMDAETRSHMFEPFFTTKELGKGTGLGLATVYGIIKQSGGYVWAYSEPGHGATFKVYLPQVDELPAGAGLPEPVLPVAGGRETVLVAEDDPSVRAIVSDVLTQKGYRVLRALDGQAALELARGHPAEIHLLVTDLVMPGMTGRELAEALTAARPGLRVLYMSGYTDDVVVRHGVLEEGMPYLQKPFTPRALASKVRELLNRT